MPRPILPLMLCAAMLSACDNQEPTESEVAEGLYGSDSRYAPVAGEEKILVNQAQDFQISAGTRDKAGATPAQSGEAYVYDHNLTLSMASEHIKARFDRARDRCQNDAALKCKVTAASFRLLGTPDAPLPVANLSVALPHDSVAVFEESLLAPLPNENKDDVRVTARTTSAENVTNLVKDIAARLSQLTNYRDRMVELSKRGGAKTDDLIKIEGEISRTQSEIEQIEAQRRDLAERIAKENLSVVFEAQSTTRDALQPVAEVWQSSLRLLGASAGMVLALLIGILPWIPVLALAFLLIRWLWRRWRRA
jgi:hypothetical protein